MGEQKFSHTAMAWVNHYSHKGESMAVSIETANARMSLVVQWLRLCDIIAERLSLQRARVLSLVGELRSHKPHI